MRQTTSVTVVDAGNQQTDTEKGKQQQRYNRHLRESVCSLALAVKSASQSQFEQRRCTAKQQALCDILLHQNLFSVLLQQRQAAVQPPDSHLQAAVIAVQQWDHNCPLCASAQQHLLQYGSSPCTAVPAGQSLLHDGQHTLLAEACAGNLYGFQHSCGQPAMHASTASTAAPGALPSSYAARLLLSATKQQLKHAATMTAHDWQNYFAALMPQLLMLLEMTTRHQYQLARSASNQQPNNMFHPAEPVQTAATAVMSARSKSYTPALLPPATGKGDRVGQAVASTSPVQVTGAAPHAPGLPGNMPCTDSCGRAGSSAQAHGVSCNPNHPAGACAVMAAAAAAADGTVALSSAGPQPVQDLCGDMRPLGVCPVLDLAQLLQTVNNAMTLVVLALVHNHLPMVQASVLNYSPGRACTAGMQHWHAVVQRMQLTEDQELQLSVCMDEFKRLAGTARQLGAAVLPHVDAPSLILAAEQAQQSRSRSPSLQLQQQDGAVAESPHTPSIEPNLQACAGLQQGGQQQQGARRAAGSKKARGGRSAGSSKGKKQGKGGTASAQPGTAQHDAAQDAQGCSYKELDHQLLRYAQLQHLHMLNLVSFVINTLSRTQLAVAFVGSYPFAPDFLALAAAASEAFAQRQQQRLEQQEQAVLQREANGSCGDEAAEPDAAAATTRAGAGGGVVADAAIAAPAAASGRKRKSRGRGRRGAGSDSDASAKAAGAQQEAQPLGGSSQAQMQLLQAVTQAHVEQRAAELLMHQELCCADLETLKTLQPSNQPTKQVSMQAQGQASQPGLQSLGQPRAQIAQLQPVPQQYQAHLLGCSLLPQEQLQHWPQQQLDPQLQHHTGTLTVPLRQPQPQAAGDTEQPPLAPPLAPPFGLQQGSDLKRPPPQLPYAQAQQQQQQLLLNQLQQQLLHDAAAGHPNAKQPRSLPPAQPHQQPVECEQLQEQNDKINREVSTGCATQYQQKQQEVKLESTPQHLLRAASMGCHGLHRPDALLPAPAGMVDHHHHHQQPQLFDASENQQHQSAVMSAQQQQQQQLFDPSQQHELLAAAAAPISEQCAQPEQLLNTAALLREGVQFPCCQPETAPLIFVNAHPMDVDC